MENSQALVASLCVIALAFIISKIFSKKQPTRNLPPGPKPWPIIGNLNLLGSVPHESLHILSQKYGGLIQLKFGNFPVVAVSSPKMAELVLKTHDDVFASRPATAAGKYLSYNYSDMTWSPYGSYWRLTRKICNNEIFSAKKMESFDSVRVEETKMFLSRLHSVSRKPVMIKDHLSHYSLSCTSRIVMSSNKYFSSSDNSVFKLEELQNLLEESFLLHGAFNIGDWVPWLSRFDVQGYVKRMKALADKFGRFLEHVIDDHIASRAAQKDFVPKDVTDVLLGLLEDPSTNVGVKLTKNSVKGMLEDLLTGGTDTSAALVEWAVHELVKNPYIINKAKEELNRVVGRNRWAEDNDFPKLSYLEAIIAETLRLHPPGTILAPHYAMEDCNVAGYDVAKGTSVLVNIWSLGRDPNSWDEPEKFSPERFEGKEIDISGGNFALLPFGSGRRKCPGYKLGLKFTRSMLANLLHGFDWKLPDGMKPEDVCLEEQYGLIVHPKVPLALIMEPTLPTHLYI
uniref:Cytochrome P450 n=1 Tax=Scoparia dulcis TaxID=107240 RepID=A0A1W7HBS3_SCODU